jgi:hypothetical protein
VSATKTRALALEDALAEIARLKHLLRVIVELEDRKGISNGRRIDQAVKLARQGLVNVEDP